MENKDLIHGLKVKCFIDNQLVEDAKLSIDDKNYVWICQNTVKTYGQVNEKFGYQYATLYTIKSPYSLTTARNVSNLEAVPETAPATPTPPETKTPESEIVQEPKPAEQGEIVKTPAQELADIIISKIPPEKLQLALTLIKTLV